MTVRDRWLALLVAVIWGLNFLAVRIGLDYFPPFFLAALRYLLVAIPVIIFVPRPNVPVRWLLGYGLGFGALQFGMLFLAIDAGMPTGLASVVLQAGAPLTVILGIVMLHEPITRRGYAGVGLAVLGLGIIAIERSQVTGIVPMLLCVLAALGWALGTLSSRKAQPESPLRFALWMSVVPPIPLLGLSAVMEGPTAGWTALWDSLDTDGLPGLGALLYIVLLGTVVSAAMWSALLKRNPASAVAPYSMLVPVVSIVVAWIALDESPGLIELAGSVLVMCGVIVGTLASRRPRPPDPVDARPTLAESASTLVESGERSDPRIETRSPSVDQPS